MLKDKVAVVTGAGRGIGREIAKTFAGYGAKVVVNFNGSEERANSLVEEIKAAGGEAVAFKANVADFAEAEALMKFAVAAALSSSAFTPSGSATLNTSAATMSCITGFSSMPLISAQVYSS